MRKKISIGFHLVRSRPEIFACQYIFGLERGHDLVACCRAGFVDLDDDVMVAVEFGRVVIQDRDARKFGQRSSIDLVVTPVNGNHLIMPIQIR